MKHDPDKPRAGDKAVEFINTHCRHTKGKWAGIPFGLRPWQEAIVRGIFGPVDSEGRRIVRTAYIEMPRKNGKSELAATIALKLLLADGEMGAEIYSAAADRDQASLVFDVAARMVSLDKDLKAKCKVIAHSKRIVVEGRGSFYRAIAADAAGSHGFNASGIIFDEVHTQKSRELWDVLTSSTGAREQPLTFAITTAGYDRQSICWELHEYALKVLSGTVVDPSFYAYVAAAPEEADWTDEKVWEACNPALGDFRNIDQLRMEAQRAKEMPAAQNTFRNLYLSQWTQQSSRWIDLALWDENAGIVDENKLPNGFYGFLDLSAVSDLTAWVMLFPAGERVDVLARFWCPESRLTDSTNRYRSQYQDWHRRGFLETTPGKAVDYAFVKKQVIADCVKHGLLRMNIDRLFQGASLGMELAEELGEDKVFAMGMGFMSFAAPMVEFERRLIGKNINHGGNPVLRFNADNVVVKKDPAGNLKPDKEHSQGKIDGIVGIVGALEALMRHTETASVYEGRGMLSV